MALTKGKVFLREPMHGDEKVLDGYVQNVDQIGAMLNSQSDGKGVLTIVPLSNVYKVELQPQPAAAGGILMPNIATLRRQ